MRIIYLLLFCINFWCFVPQDSYCQWYNRSYGVDSLTELNPEQYEDIIKRANKNIRIAKPLNIIGTVGVVTGFAAIGGGILMVTMNLASAMTNSSSEFDNLGNNGMKLILMGVPTLGIGAITAGYGMTSRAIWWKRKSNLLKAKGISNSSIGISPYFEWHSDRGYFGAKVSFPLLR